MTDRDLLQEIRRVREKIARECDYDVHKIGERMRRRECEEMARGVRYVSPPATIGDRDLNHSFPICTTVSPPSTVRISPVM